MSEAGRVAEHAAVDVAAQAAFDAIVATCRPAVIRGLCRDWSITRAAADSADALAHYVAALDAGRSAEAFVGAPTIGGRYYYEESLDGFNFARETIGVTAALRRVIDTAGVEGAPTLYLGSLPTAAYLPRFADDNPLPLLPAAARPRIWLGHASVVACHHDNSDNLACVVAGQRRFTLYPPDAIADLYVGPIDHNMAGQPVSLAAGTPPGDPHFPRFAAARERALVVDLAPGDALFLPKLWWHQVEATSPVNVLVNYWWDAFATGPDAPYTAMLLAIAAIAERPEGERAAWRAFFDHYVFRPDGHPLAHLPEERHGLLGRGQGGKLRAMVMRLLRG
ncbi:cupin-like domain-containing protein [Sphingomonas sp. DT-51]|uniref:cupin-like domain-containing protein n=1 Tax=Sphingomonas sp. DT-51 TaxID=3396165 RepID=UPI003F1DBD02